MDHRIAASALVRIASRGCPEYAIVRLPGRLTLRTQVCGLATKWLNSILFHRRPSSRDRLRYKASGVFIWLLKRAHLVFPSIPACFPRWTRRESVLPLQGVTVAKTAMEVRSEREAKPSGVLSADKLLGQGRLLLTTLSMTPLSVKTERIDRTILANLGVPLRAGMDSGKPLFRTGVLVRALACGSFSKSAAQPTTEPWHRNTSRADSAMAGREWRPIFEESGAFDLTKLNLPGAVGRPKLVRVFGFSVRVRSRIYCLCRSSRRSTFISLSRTPFELGLMTGRFPTNGTQLNWP